MPAGADEIFRIGGFMFSRTSVAVSVDGVPYTGIVEVDGEEAREGELQHGQRTDGTPLGITSGLYMPGPLTFKTYIDTGEQMCQQLSIPGFGSFGSYLWTMVLEIFENPLLPSLTITWNNVKIEKRKFTLPTDVAGLMYQFDCKHQGMVTVGAGVGLTGLPNILANLSSLTNGL
jgi:hypothetical protein